MDDMRSMPKKEYQWSAWHYIDSDKTDDGKNFTVPEGPNVVWAIREGRQAARAVDEFLSGSSVLPR